MKTLPFLIVSLIIFSCTRDIEPLKIPVVKLEPGKKIPKEENVDADSLHTVFNWEESFDEDIQDCVLEAVVNKEYIENLRPQAKAALAYAATYVGSDCEWDGEANVDKSNLLCKLTQTLDIGYQCSEQHLDFLRKYFAKDDKNLKRITKDKCYCVPTTATVQRGLNFLKMKQNGDTITIQSEVDFVDLAVKEYYTDNFVLEFLIEGEFIRLLDEK
ncbi:hypothetical protein SAMN05216474_0466 [Lishizhenia tianjinensis]|uniref:Lipoprotein n=1 Tax=Lishizhenia tianjinensis TaxID=477690 RepID=A0A1I6XUG1_9FLAO|nr:hypothetical protein [Lishizhenia tianjinensis]SFT42099.1 hypothetical protein SAMN05216474_0466 [Lishizhenia tianjinensis]